MPLAFERLAAAIRRGDVAAVYTLAGEDRLQQREVLAALHERVPEIGRHVLDGTQCAPGDIVAALRTAGLCPGRLVVVDDPRWMLPPRRGGARRGAAPAAGAAAEGAEDGSGVQPNAGGDGDPEGGHDDQAGDPRALLAYLDHPVADAVLVLRSSVPVDRRRRLTRKAGERGVQLPTVPPGPADAARWIQDRAGGLGLRLERGTLDLIVSRLEGATCERIDSELRKLAAWSGSAAPDRRAIDALLPATREERVFDLLDAAATGQGARALALAGALRAQGEAVPLLLFLLAKHLRTLVRVADACADGSRPEEVAGRLSLHPFVAKKALQQSRRFSPAAFVASWDAVWEAEVGFKSGRLQEDRAFDHALLGVIGAVGATRARPEAPSRGPRRGAVGRTR